jgi:nitrate reductase gamma subunit
MGAIYEFVRGPLALISFAVFFVGIIYRIIWYVKGLDWRLDRVAYSTQRKLGIKGAIRSLFHWLLPLNRTTTNHPIFMGATYLFHLCLLIAPIFLVAHVVLIEESWNISWITIPDPIADYMTMVVIAVGIFFLIRRLSNPDVRIITDGSDYLVLAIALAPFITGILAYHQIFDNQLMTILHMLAGEIMLIAIPFTKLCHFVLFFCSRIQLGMDYGIKRGGAFGRGIAW